MKKQVVIINLFLIILFLLINLSFVFAQTYTLKVTDEHPFWVASSSLDEDSKFDNVNEGQEENIIGKSEVIDDNTGTWKKANELRVGDLLVKDNGKRAKITSIKEVINDVEVYNLEANPFNDYIAEGDVVVHNSNSPYWMDPNKVYTNEKRLANARELIGDILDSQCSFVDSTGTTRFMTVAEAILYAHNPENFKTPMEKFLFLRSLKYSNGKLVFPPGEGYDKIFILLKNNICGGTTTEEIVIDSLMKSLNLKPDRISPSDASTLKEVANSITQLSSELQTALDLGDVSLFDRMSLGSVEVVETRLTSGGNFCIIIFRITKLINNKQIEIQIVFKKTENGYVLTGKPSVELGDVITPLADEIPPSIEEIEKKVFSANCIEVLDFNGNSIPNPRGAKGAVSWGVYFDIIETSTGKPLRRFYWVTGHLFKSAKAVGEGFDAGWCIKHKAYENGYGLNLPNGYTRTGFQNPEKLIVEFLQRVSTKKTLEEMRAVYVEGEGKNPCGKEVIYKIKWEIEKIEGVSGEIYYIDFFHAREMRAKTITDINKK